MNEFVQGKNVILRVLVGQDYIPYACAEALTFTSTRETIPATTATSGTHRKYRYRYADWSVTLSGLTYIENSETDSITIFDALNSQSRQEGHEIEIMFIDEQGRSRVIRGRCLIPQLSITGDVEDFSDWEIEYQGNGVYTLTDFTPPVNASEVKKKDFTAQGGETSFQHADLIGRVLLAWLTDMGSFEIITTGVPTAKQVKYDGATGTVSFSDAAAPGTWHSALYK